MSAEDEERIRQWLDTSMTPDEYAARNAHRWVCFSLHEYRYADRSLEAWIVRFADILFHEGDAPTLDALRTRYLSTSERKVIARELAALDQEMEDLKREL